MKKEVKNPKGSSLPTKVVVNVVGDANLSKPAKKKPK